MDTKRDLLISASFLSIFVPLAFVVAMWFAGEFDGTDGVRNAIASAIILSVFFSVLVPLVVEIRKDAREFTTAVSQRIVRVEPSGTVDVAFFGTFHAMPAWVVTFEDGTEWIFSNGEPAVGAAGNEYARSQYRKRL